MANSNHTFYNGRGQNVGVYNEISKSYHTKRYAMRGEIFLRKLMFNGQRKEQAIAIDKAIIDHLIWDKCEEIIITIVGVEINAFSVSISPLDVLHKGIKINYDKQNPDGTMTNYGTQYVISSIKDCKRVTSSPTYSIQKIKSENAIHLCPEEQSLLARHCDKKKINLNKIGEPTWN